MGNCTVWMYWESRTGNRENDQLDVLRDFKESVVRKQDGRYEIGYVFLGYRELH